VDLSTSKSPERLFLGDQQIDEDVRERDVRELFKDQLNRDAKSSDVNGRRKITSDVKVNPDVNFLIPMSSLLYHNGFLFFSVLYIFSSASQ
jgi:hypothetical protein